MTRRGDVPVETLTKLVVFSQTFVNRCHHGKEEGYLFPCLENRGIPREGGPIAVMLHEHQVGKKYVEKVRDALGKYGERKADAEELAGICSGYAAHLR